jgi:hypothetical protein
MPHVSRKSAHPPFETRDAPFIFFDVPSSIGEVDGVIRITLAAVRVVPKGDGGMRAEAAAVAYLRCGKEAARSLHDLLDRLLRQGEETEYH